MSEDAVPLPTLADIEAAREALKGVSVYTPMEESRWLSDIAHGPVLLKAENLQRTGSFKIRGAYLRMCRLPEEDKANGVVAASAGNHAQGVALAAQMLGIKATVFMPEGAPIPKEKATRGYGADVRFHGHTVDEALVEAKRFAEETGAVLIHPFDHADIVTGQGTCGLEILEQCPEVKTVLVSTGGGGFIAGIATAIKEQRPDVKVVGVQAERAAAYVTSLQEGRPVALGKMATMADGIAVGCPGEIPFRLVQRYVDDMVTVSEESLSRALLMLLERAKLVVEPAGAAAVAALLDAPHDFETPAVAVLSGGNVDAGLLAAAARRHETEEGRRLVILTSVADRPGNLARLLGELADLEANVLDVMHERTSPLLRLDEVEVAMQVETRGPQHADRVLARLRERGYQVLQ